MSELVDFVLLFGVVLGGIGYGFGQFLAQKRRAQSDALDTALKEVQAMRLRSDRLEAELEDVRAALTTLESENRVLRDLIREGRLN
jgi:hypothetical protein